MTDNSPPQVTDYTLFFAEMDTITTEMVRSFLAHQQRERLFTETTTIEFKRARDGMNVAESVCALANTEGGVIFVGVDEKQPDRMPGVARGELEAVADQCMAVLEPRWSPEIVAVAADEPERVVLVVRVDPQVSPQRPVLCKGRAFLRAPGVTVRASRDQLLALAGTANGADATASYGGVSVSSSHYPRGRSGASDDSDIPDLRLRAAGGLWLRPSTASGIVLGEALRRDLKDAIDRSDVRTWGSGNLPLHEDTEWRVLSARSGWWEVRRRLPRHGPPTVDLHAYASSQGQHLSYYVDAEVWHQAEPTNTMGSSLLSLRDALEGLLHLVALVTVEIPQRVNARLVTPALRQDATTVWMMPALQDLHRLIRLDEYAHETESADARAALLQITTPATTASGIRADLAHGLAILLLDDGIRDAEALATALIDDIPITPRPRPWI